MPDSAPASRGITAENPAAGTIVVGNRTHPGYDGYFESAERTRNSYTAAHIEGVDCTGNWIGPHVMATAAHCLAPAGPSGGYASPILYPSDSGNPPAPRAFVSPYCTYAITDWLTTLPPSGVDNSGDFAALHCQGLPSPLPAHYGPAIPPGAVYGTVDWDLRPYSATTMQELYNTWWNPLGGPSGPDHLFASRGPLHGVPSGLRGAGGLSGPPAPSFIEWYQYGLCLNAGVSGSLYFDPATHRALVGPHSSGLAGVASPCVTNQSPTYVNGHVSVSARSLLQTGMLHRTSNPHQINAAYLTGPSVGLDPTEIPLLDGALDADANGVIDVNQKLDEHFGRAPADAYHFDFVSRRRNATWIWDNSTSVAFEPDWTDGVGRLSGRLRLQPGHVVVAEVPAPANPTFGEAYTSFTLRADVDPTCSNHPVRVAFIDGTGLSRFDLLQDAQGALQWSAGLPQPEPHGYTSMTDIQLGGEGYVVLGIPEFEECSADIDTLALFRHDGTMDFDLAVKRRGWLDATGQGEALFIPSGVNVDALPWTTPDWALVVPATVPPPGSTDWRDAPVPVQNHVSLPMEPGREYEVCLRYTVPAADADLVFLDTSRAVVDSVALPTPLSGTGWQPQFCTLYTPGDHMGIGFRARRGAPGDYMKVDDITVRSVHLPAP